MKSSSNAFSTYQMPTISHLPLILHALSKGNNKTRNSGDDVLHIQSSTQKLCFQNDPNATWKICISSQQLEELVNWFHLTLNHCGLYQLLTTIRMHLYHPRLRCVTERITQECDVCQHQKLTGPQYAHLPPCKTALLPWKEVALDLIGPWTVKKGQEVYDFYSLTCIDPVTNFTDAIGL
jgi:hypothetical protein